VGSDADGDQQKDIAGNSLSQLERFSTGETYVYDPKACRRLQHAHQRPGHASPSGGEFETGAQTKSVLRWGISDRRELGTFRLALTVAGQSSGSPIKSGSSGGKWPGGPSGFTGAPGGGEGGNRELDW
jgi:hypothetical protein